MEGIFWGGAMRDGDLILIQTPEWVWDDVDVKSGRIYPAVTYDSEWILAVIYEDPRSYPNGNFRPGKCQVVFRTGIWDGRLIHFDVDDIRTNIDEIGELAKRYKVNPEKWEYRI